MRRRGAAVVALLAVLVPGGLTACSLARTSSQDDLVVDFQDRNATAARATVRERCGSLPGISVVPPRAKDVSVYFDISKASNAQANALANCVSDLASDRTLGIRGFRFDDGTGT